MLAETLSKCLLNEMSCGLVKWSKCIQADEYLLTGPKRLHLMARMTSHINKVRTSKAGQGTEDGRLTFDQ